MFLGFPRLPCTALVMAGVWGAALPAAAQWDPLGPPGADIRVVTGDSGHPGRFLAGSRANGVFLSEDDGATWTQRSQGLPIDLVTGSYEPVFGVTVDLAGNRIFACTGKGLYTSSNSGSSWQAFPNPPGVAVTANRLLQDPNDPERFVLHYYAGIYTYEVNGDSRSWVKATGITSVPVHEIVRAPGEALLYYAVSGGVPKLFRSTDGARTWQKILDPIPGAKFRDLAVDPAAPGRVYLATETGAYASPDSGASFARLDDPADEGDLYQFVCTGGSVLALGRGACFTNVDDPDHLAPESAFAFTRVVGSFVVGDRLLLASDMGLLDGAWSGSGAVGPFTLQATGMNGADIPVVAAAPHSDVLYAAAGQSFDAGLYRSPDGGLTWSHRAEGLRNPDLRSIAVFSGNPDIVYVGTSDARDDFGEDGGVWKTTDGGLTWTDLSANIPHPGGRIIIALLVHPTNPDIVWASVQSLFGGIYKTIDGGATWTHVSSGLESMPPTEGWLEFHNYYAMLSLTAPPQNPDQLYIGAGGCWGGTYRSENGGGSWERRAQGYMEIDSYVLDYADVTGESAELWFPVHLELFDIDIAPWDGNRLFATGARGDLFLTGPQQGIIFQSHDAGETWTILHERARTDYFTAPTSSMALHAQRPEQIYVAARDGVKVSTDDGATWGNLNDGLAPIHRFTRGIAFDEDDPNRLYLATAFGGVWRRALVPTPVRLTHFAAALLPAGKVELTWTVAEAENHAGFHVEREAAGHRERLTSELLTGQVTYRFQDASPIRGMENRYWLTELDRTGRATDYGPVSITPPVFTRFALGPARPNPLRAETRIAWEGLSAGTSLAVRVLDAQGREVSRLMQGVGEPAGEIVWRATDARGSRVPAGVYFLEARAGAIRQVQRVLVLP